MEKHVLSKSTFIRGVQCLKSLYLNKKRPFLRDKIPLERRMVFQRGHEVGKLAHQLFPGGVDLSPGHPSRYRKAVGETRDKIESGYPVLYEACFQYDGVLVFMDILVHTADGWHAYEVKSSRGISETYLMDAALQYYVISGSGTALKSISIIHVDENYIRENGIEPDDLFRKVDVTAEALSRQEYIREQIIREKETLELPHSPRIDVGPHCRDPYDCDFIGHCWKNIPPPPAKELADHFKPDAGFDELKKLQEDVAYIKLLSMKPAVPLYTGTHPYQEIAYAYALSSAGSINTHILPPGLMPAARLKEMLTEDLRNISKLVCYGQKKLLNELTPGNINILDLREILAEDSELQLTHDGESDLARLISLAASGLETPEYTSDRVCEHHYLRDSDSPDTLDRIKDYLHRWNAMIAGLFTFLDTKQQF